MRRALLVMAKRPMAGGAKTRLSPPFSPQGAARLYECFLKDTCDIVRSVAGVNRFLAFWPPDEAEYFTQLAPDFAQIPQEGGALNERLDHVMTRGSEMGFAQVVAINSDSPTLPVAYLIQAFSVLDDAGVDVVLGPCADGGYYLIGWKQPNGRLVRDVQMSTSHVIRDTLRLAEEEGLHVSSLPTWYDVDSVEDLLRLQQDLLAAPNTSHHTRHFLTEMTSQVPDLLGSDP